ncbi:MAG TPA: penicillin-binding transpeptidase domain-containing protein, partial [Armatimonadota bacterium]|nr:penicillin-binding transpeptidase domain-containing protein [Armatimonadota bacterium]
VTDLHMLAIYAAVANDGMMLYPNIVKEVRGEDGTLIRRRQPSEAGRLYGPGASREMLKYLESNVERGTGHSAKIEGVRVGGKTGTAQIFDQKTQRFLASEYVMSFAAVAPIEDPQFVVLVRVSRPKHGQHASDTAAPAARRALDAALRMADDAPADETEVTPA